jgi:hypothetical protein
MISTNPVRPVLGLAAAALSALLLSAEAPAQGKSGGKARTESQAASNKQLRQAIAVLRSAKVTLEMADHDYGGHRAAAVRDINAATRQLRLALNHGQKNKAGAGKKKGPAPGKGARPAEPQAVSDKQLADTIPVLKQTITVLQNANHDYGGHRAQAVTDVRAAVRQLETALKYSRTHNQNKN